MIVKLFIYFELIRNVSVIRSYRRICKFILVVKILNKFILKLIIKIIKRLFFPDFCQKLLNCYLANFIPSFSLLSKLFIFSFKNIKIL